MNIRHEQVTKLHKTSGQQRNGNYFHRRYSEGNPGSDITILFQKCLFVYIYHSALSTAEAKDSHIYRSLLNAPAVRSFFLSGWASYVWERVGTGIGKFFSWQKTKKSKSESERSIDYVDFYAV